MWLRVVVAAAVIAVGVWLGIGFFGVSGPPKTTVRGVVTLVDSATESAHCVGQGEYSDITEGQKVILTNEAGKTLGSATLSRGAADASRGACVHTFSIPDVPQNQAQYALEIGRGNPVVASYVELQQQQWTFSVGIGS